MVSAAGLRRRFFGENVKVDIQLIGDFEKEECRDGRFLHKNDKSDTICGKILTIFEEGKIIEHLGIKVEWIGQIEFLTGNKGVHRFSYSSQEVAGPGELRPDSEFDFELVKIDDRYESYYGTNVRLRYIIRATLAVKISHVSYECDVVIRSFTTVPIVNTPVRRELRIEGALLLDFECERTRYYLEDVMVGRIIFRTVRVKIKRMEISIVRTEKIIPDKRVCDSETIKRYEIIYGYPARGVVAPIRLHLKYANLTPSYPDVNKKFSVSYFICVILIDEQSRKYSRKQEIELLRSS